MEIGYLSSESAFSRKEYGPWKFCAEADLQRIIGDSEKKIKLSAMADIGRIEYDDIPPKAESSLDMVRVACYVHQIDKAIALAHHCMDKGYETTINLMAVSTVGLRELEEALDDLAKSRVPIIYLVDSFGAFYSEDIDVLAKKYMASLPDKTIGIHCPQQPAAGLCQHHRRRSSTASTIWMPPCTASAAAPATARWNCCSSS